MTEPTNSCPDRFTLFLGLEEESAELKQHLSLCPRCRELAQAERALSGPLARLSDPIPPLGVLSGALERIAELERASRSARRELWSAFAAALAFAAGLCLVLWRPLVLDALLGARHALSQTRVAAGALERAFGPSLEHAAVPLVALEAMALLGFAFVLHHLLAPQRSPSAR